METTVNKNLYAMIKQASDLNYEKAIIDVDNNRLSHREFIQDTKTISSALRNIGVLPGQKIGMIMNNSTLWFKIYWSIVKTGGHPVPLDPQIGEWEMERLLTLADIKICFINNSYRANNILAGIQNVRACVPNLKYIISVDNEKTQGEIISFEQFISLYKSNDDFIYTPNEQDTLMLACTSGSTGNPKVIAVPHIGFYQSQKDMAAYLDFNSEDRMLLGMPLYHQGGFGMGLQMLLMNGTVHYQPVFEPVKFLKTIEEKKITVIQLTATLAKIILTVPDFDKYDLSSVRMSYFAGEVLPMEIARIFFKKLGIRVVNVIGSSETATMVVWDSKYDRDVDVNVFRPLEFTEMKVLDSDINEVQVNEVGQIFIRTDALISEYYKNEAETSNKIFIFDNKRWFNTGDLGLKCADGRVKFVGRAKRIIKRGSNLVCPEEIESFLLTHPGIEAIAVIGEKDELIGEKIVAHIQPKSGFEITKSELVKFCNKKLSAYKIPDQVIIHKELPNDIGKIQFKYINKQ